jgi:hypothetical protein
MKQVRSDLLQAYLISLTDIFIQDQHMLITTIIRQKQAVTGEWV